MQQQCCHCHHKYNLTVAKLLTDVKCFDYKCSRFVFLLLAFQKFLKPNQHFALKKTFPYSKKFSRCRLTINTALLVCCCSGLVVWTLCFPNQFAAGTSQRCAVCRTVTVLIIRGMAAHWIAADKRAVVWSSGSDSANTIRGCGGYIAAPWRTKWILRCRREISKCEYELRHVCLSIRLSLRPSACPNATARIAPDGFSWKLMWTCFSEICR